MKHELKLLTQNQPAVLERLLQVTRYRGFKICALNMQPTRNQQLEINFVLESEKPVRLLITQLAKLVDVSLVYLTNTDKTKKIFESNLSAALVTTQESQVASA